jgi:hypothetical protein
MNYLGGNLVKKVMDEGSQYYNDKIWERDVEPRAFDENGNATKELKNYIDGINDTRAVENGAEAAGEIIGSWPVYGGMFKTLGLPFVGAWKGGKAALGAGGKLIGRGAQASKTVGQVADAAGGAAKAVPPRSGWLRYGGKLYRGIDKTVAASMGMFPYSAYKGVEGAVDSAIVNELNRPGTINELEANHAYEQRIKPGPLSEEYKRKWQERIWDLEDPGWRDR